MQETLRIKGKYIFSGKLNYTRNLYNSEQMIININLSLIIYKLIILVKVISN